MRKRSAWVADSGASRHMAWSREGFSNYKRHEGEIFTANGDTFDVIGKGDFRIGLGSSKITLEDVLHAPDLTDNLLSISTMVRHGFTTVTDVDGMKIYHSKKLIAWTRDSGGMYTFSDESTNAALLGRSSEVSRREYQGKKQLEHLLWHRRLGHASDAIVKRMRRGEAESGVKETTIQTSDEICEPCKMAKSQLSISKSTNRATSRVLELVHIDTWGPAPTGDPLNKMYFLTITDDYSRKLWIRALSGKGHAQGEFLEWKREAETESEQMIKALRSDNAKEFIQLAEVLRTHGVKFEPSPPYQPGLNGISERVNRTLFDKVRAMLAGAKLPQPFWIEAANTAAYLHNKMPHGPKKRAPDSIWQGKSISIAHLKAFGCMAYVHIPSQKRSKLELRAWKGIMVGYNGNSIYRIFNPVTNKIELSASIVFNETKFGLEEARNTSTIIRVATMAEEPHTFGQLESTTHGTTNVQGPRPNATGSKARDRPSLKRVETTLNRKTQEMSNP
jgi:transposase InsO family protein